MGKTGQRVGACIATLVLLGGAGAFYVASSPTLEHKLITGHAPVKPLPFGAIKVGGKVIPLADQTVGWNTAKTRYVFPEGAGLLPASEVKLAHEDPAYMAALTAAAASPVGQAYLGAPGDVGWYSMGGGRIYLAGSGGGGVGVDVIGTKLYIGGGGNSGGPPSTLKIINSRLWKIITTPTPNGTPALPGSGWAVGPTMYAVMAAPFGTVVIHGQTMGAYCVPNQTGTFQDGAWLKPPYWGGPSGPSTVFASPTSGKYQPIYQYGIASCKNFRYAKKVRAYVSSEARCLS